MMRRVVKLGGSLLDWPHVWERVDHWLQSEPQCTTVLVVGGGKLVDAIRELDATFAVAATLTHRWSLQAMTVHAELAAERIPGARLLTDPQQLEFSAAHQRWVADAAVLLPQLEAHASCPPLPESWDVTSDSIAAWLARVWRAELTLLKSSLPPSKNIATLADCGYVDRYLVEAARGLALRCVNLRDATFAAQMLDPLAADDVRESTSRRRS
jgi:aspartokinase-like uncharacterized kinase